MGRHYTRRGVLGAVASDGTRGRHSLAGAVGETNRIGGEVIL